MRNHHFLSRCLVTIGLALPLSTVPAESRSTRYSDRLTVHVEEAMGEPGGHLAVVLRAYASRPIGQGQVCFTAKPMGQPLPETTIVPLLSYTDSVVFSAAGDAQIEFTDLTDDDPPRFLLRFVSSSASVNRYDGPLAAIFFRLNEDVAPGSRFELVIDAADTEFLDADGKAIEFDLVPGELSVREPADPFVIAAAAGPVVRGAAADLAVRTFEPVPWSAGQVGIRYDPEILSGVPDVRMDPRHGLASFRFDTPTPGLLIVDFSSPDASLNRVPGNLIRIGMTASLAARPKATTRFWLDPALTWVVGEDGELLPVKMMDDDLEPLPPSEGRRGGYR